MTSTTPKTVTAGASAQTVTIELTDGNLGNLFQIYYSVAYNKQKTPDNLTTNFTPSLKVDGTEVAKGDALSVTTACGIEIYPSLRYSSDGNSVNGNTVNWDTEYASKVQQPNETQLAVVGAHYSLKLQAAPKFLDDTHAYSVAEPNYSATAPQTVQMKVVLPLEATLVSTPAGFTQSTEGGRIVLTATPPMPGDMGGHSYMSGYLSNFPVFKVVYGSAPANGTHYVYDTSISGTWWDGSAFNYAKTANHVYSNAAAAGPDLKMNNKFSVATRYNDVHSAFSNGKWSILGSDAEYWAIGDYHNLVYWFSNAGDGPAKDAVVTFDLSNGEGEKWDFSFMAFGKNTMCPSPVDSANPTKPFKSITVHYSDGSTKTANFTDTSLFNAGAFRYAIGDGNYSNISTAAFEGWINKAGVAVNKIEIALDEIGVGEECQIALEGKLRATEITTGTEIVPGSQIAINSSITGKDSSNTALTPKNAAEVKRTICSADTPQIAYGIRMDITSGDNGSAYQSQYSAGSTIHGTSSFAFRDPPSYRAIIENPSFNIIVPNTMALDVSSIGLRAGGNTMTAVDPANYIVDEMVEDEVNGVRIYTINYSGTMVYRDDWKVIVDYDLVIPKTAPVSEAKIISVMTAGTGLGVGKEVVSTSGEIPNVWNLKNPDGTTVQSLLAGFTGKFQLYVPEGITVDTNAKGNIDGANSWFDSFDFDATSAEDRPAKLGRGTLTGDIRSTLINNTDNLTNAGVGVIYTQKPVGDFVPVLKGVTATAIGTAAGSTAAAITPTYYYTTADASSMKDIDPGNWVVFTNASSVPATATAFKAVLPQVDARTRIDIVYEYDIPTTATNGKYAVARSEIKATTSADVYTTGKAGFRVIKPSYQVEYYKDTVSGAPFQTSNEINSTLDATITLASGTANGELNWNQPAGYKAGVQQAPVPSTPMTEGKTIIKVLFEKRTDLEYTINYYKDAVTSVDGTGYLGQKTYTGQTFDSNITVAAGTEEGQKDWKLPDVGYASPGVVSGVTEVGANSATNIVNVVYSKKTDLTYTINYYKDAITNTGDTATFLGTTEVTGQTFAAGITVAAGKAAGQKDWKLPEAGYQSGVVSGVSTVGDPSSDNIVNVLYVKQNDLTYTVRYYKDAVTDTTDFDNFMGSTVVTGQTFDDAISIASGTAEGQLDWMLPAKGFIPGVVVAGSVTAVGDPATDNIVNVLYERKTDLSYTVRYYKDAVSSPSDATFLGATTVNGQTFEDSITIAAGTAEGQLDWKIPAGYLTGEVASNSVVMVGDPSEENIVNVVYNADPAQQGSSDGTSGKSGSGKSPRTGDSLLFVGFGAASLVALVLLVLAIRRRRTN